jgi:hypothetical protein
MVRTSGKNVRRKNSEDRGLGISQKEKGPLERQERNGWTVLKMIRRK